MKFTTLSVAAAAFFTAASAAKAVNTNPHVGDVTHEATMYSLYTYSETGYRGKAARLEPHECTVLGDHGIKPKSIQFNGNNCCFFFPKNDCSKLHAGQRIVGSIPDVSVWGFPHGIGAVKCLSHAACSVIKHQSCEIDRHCDRYEEQARCPFVPSCSAYSPVHPSDWSQFKLPPVAVDEESGYEYTANPVRERFFVTGDGDVVNVEKPHGVSPLEHHRAHLAATAAGTAPHHIPPPVKVLQPPTLIQPSQGGTDNYEQAAAGAKPGLPKKTAKKASKAAKKEAKKKHKEEKKKSKQDKKQQKKLAKILAEERYHYGGVYGDEHDEYDEYDEYDY